MLCCGGYLLLKKQKRPCAAQWYGKVATVMFYISVSVIVVIDGFFPVKPVTFEVVAYVLLILTAAMMIYSAVRYFPDLPHHPPLGGRGVRALPQG